jgi:phi LC3 family holin
MKINWKIRFKNKVFLATFFSLIIGFVFNMLALFDIYPKVTQNQIAVIVSNALEFLGLLGIIVDPTTPGAQDSDRAMAYIEPGVLPDEE